MLEHSRIRHFNSTMVRLKAFYKVQNETAIPRFQFHYGTIKRSWIITKNKRVRKFQFHYGTIKSRSTIF